MENNKKPFYVYTEQNIKYLLELHLITMLIMFLVSLAFALTYLYNLFNGGRRINLECKGS